MAEAESQPVTLEYPKAGFAKRIFAFLFDFLCAALLASCFVALGSVVLTNLPFYAEAASAMDAIELESGLYAQSGDSVVPITEIYVVSSSSSSAADYASLNAEYEAALTAFYSSTEFFPDGEGIAEYEALKIGPDALTYDNGGISVPYWEYQVGESGEGSIVPSCDDETLNSFYVTAVDDCAIPTIAKQSAAYIDASRIVFASSASEIIISFLLGVLVFFFLVPLFFPRGYPTLGKKLFRLAILDASALSPSRKTYLFRSAVYFFLEFTLSLFSFLIPLFVSFTMFAVRKDGQSFHDYVAGTYVVDASDEYIYRSRAEYDERNAKNGVSQLKDAGELVEK